LIAANLDAAKDIRKIDLARLKGETDLVDQTLGDLRAVVSKTPTHGIVAYGPDGIGDLDRYIELSSKFLAETRYLWRSVRDNQPIDDNTFTFGTRYESDLINRFNDLANMANPPG
jgi:hypothetical protein